MTFSAKTTIALEALAKLLTQFKEKDGIEAMMNAFTAEFQELENINIQLLNERSIDTAVGSQLDGIGRILNIQRGGSNDDDYRLRLRVQIAINQSSGTTEDILNILVLAFNDGAETLILTEPTQAAGIAEFTIELFGTEIDEATAEVYASFIKAARAAGVYAYFAYSTTEGSGSPYFSYGPDPDVDGNSEGFDTGAFIGAVES